MTLSSKALRICFLSLLTPLLLMACSGSKEQADESSQKREEKTAQKEKDRKEEEMKALVKDFKHLDGCRYLLIGPNDKKFLPLNLDTAFHQDSLKVKLSYRKKDAITTCMAGTTIEVIDMEKIE